MAELLESVASWRSLLLVVGVFGFAPGFVLRLLVKIYPREDPRRAELVAQLYTLGRLERPFFVAEQLETVLFDGIPSRRRARRARKSKSAPEIDLKDGPGLGRALMSRSDLMSPMIRNARTNIDSVSVARGVRGADAYKYWASVNLSDLDLLGESMHRDVRIRWIFVVDAGRPKSPVLRDVWRAYAARGIEIRILEAPVLSRLPLGDLVVFDNVVAVENYREATVVESDDVRKHIATFCEAWNAAVPWS